MHSVEAQRFAAERTWNSVRSSSTKVTMLGSPGVM